MHLFKEPVVFIPHYFNPFYYMYLYKKEEPSFSN